MRAIKEESIRTNISRLLMTNELMLVLKDNAYGFGIPFMVRIAKDFNIKDIAVKNTAEGKLVRRLYPEANILILGKLDSRELEKVKKYNLIPTINDAKDYVLFKEANIFSHLGIDVGMNRFGVKNNYLPFINDKNILAIYTHLGKNEDLNKIEDIEKLAKNYHKKVHIGGSMAYGRTSSKLRVGRILYENALLLYGKIVNVKRVKKGERIGYDGLYQAEEDTLIGVCDIGYVNGLSLLFKGRVCIKGRFYPVVGKCCMDHCFIKIDYSVIIGDIVEFFGDKIKEEEFCFSNVMTKYQLYLEINQHNKKSDFF